MNMHGGESSRCILDGMVESGEASESSAVARTDFGGPRRRGRTAHGRNRPRRRSHAPPLSRPWPVAASKRRPQRPPIRHCTRSHGNYRYRWSRWSRTCQSPPVPCVGSAGSAAAGSAGSRRLPSPPARSFDLIRRTEAPTVPVRRPQRYLPPASIRRNRPACGAQRPVRAFSFAGEGGHGHRPCRTPSRGRPPSGDGMAGGRSAGGAALARPAGNLQCGDSSEGAGIAPPGGDTGAAAPAARTGGRTRNRGRRAGGTGAAPSPSGRLPQPRPSPPPERCRLSFPAMTAPRLRRRSRPLRCVPQPRFLPHLRSRPP